MDLAKNAMGLGLRTLNRVAGSDIIDRLGFRKSSEIILFRGTRAGFRTAAAASRAFRAAEKLLKPARLSAPGPRGLFDLTPTEDQEMLRDAARTFATEQLRTAALEADDASAAPAEVLRQSAELGITMVGIPEELGGVGTERSTTTNVLVAEALGHGDMGLAVAVLAPSAVSTALVLWGNAEQQSKYLPAFVSDASPVAALAVLEPRPGFDPFTLRTRARKSNGGYVLNGVKSLVPRAAESELFVVAADLEGTGPALFIIESSTQGVSVEREPAMGLRAASTGRLLLEDVHVPAAALLGDAAKDVYAECIQLGRIAWCALAVGTSQAVLDYVIPYVNERVAFGEPVSNRQAVAFAVADIGIELEGMRLVTWRAASRAEQGLPFAREAALARRLCTDKGMAIGNDGVQLLGGHGYVKEHPVERWYRDLRSIGLMEGCLLV